MYSIRNKLPRTWKPDNSYWDFLEAVPNPGFETLVNSQIRHFTNYYQLYLSAKRQSIPNIKSVTNYDSLWIHLIREFIPENGLLRQLVLSEFINSNFSKHELGVWENHMEVIHEIITEPFLIDPIKNRYAGFQK